MLSVLQPTVMVNAREPGQLVESFTEIVKFAVPNAVGVPLMTPFVSVKPAGNAPVALNV